MSNKPIGISSLPESDLTVFRSPKRVRALVGDQPIADSRNALLLRGNHIKPVYLFPVTAIAQPLLRRSALAGRHRSGLDVAYWDLVSEPTTRANAAWSPLTGLSFDSESLSGYIGLDWSAADRWFEEDEEIFAHPRDPNVRVDALQSTSHVEVVVRGQGVAETRRPVLLFHTGLVTRFYIPKADIRTDLLLPSPTTARCPYVGLASYWSGKLPEADPIADIAWEYRDPVPGMDKIKGLVAFDRELVDEIRLDGIPAVL